MLRDGDQPWKGREGKKELSQGWANYGPQAKFGLLRFLIRLAEFKEIILIVTHKIDVFHPFF